MKLSSSRKLPAPIRNTITGTAIIEVPPSHSFLVPVLLAADTPTPDLTDTVLAVSVITVFPPNSRLAAAPALNEGTAPVPVFTVAGTLRGGGFYDNPVRFTDISLIPRARQELRAALQQILAEMQAQAPAPPAEGEGGQLIPVDFTAPRTSSKRAVRT